MRVVAGQMPRITPEFLLFAQQLGLEGVHLNTPDLPGDTMWEVRDLAKLRRACEDKGLRLEAIENIPIAFYRDVILGGSRRDQQIENVKRTIGNLGRAGIGVLGYHWMAQSVWRTGIGPQGRGGAIVTSFDASIAENPARSAEVYVAQRDQRLDDTWIRGAAPASETVDRAEIREHHDYFMERILPAAEQAEVVLALHPDDPPLTSLGGIGRAFCSVQDLIDVADRFTSDAWQVDLCLGSVSEMGGEREVLRAIAELGSRGKIAYCHMRDVLGTDRSFSECFIDEGNYDTYTVIHALHDVGFDGFLIDDHVPAMVNDSDYGHRSRAFAIGYLKALVRSLGLPEPDGIGGGRG